MSGADNTQEGQHGHSRYRQEHQKHQEQDHSGAEQQQQQRRDTQVAAYSGAEHHARGTGSGSGVSETTRGTHAYPEYGPGNRRRSGGDGRESPSSERYREDLGDRGRERIDRHYDAASPADYHRSDSRGRPRGAGSDVYARRDDDRSKGRYGADERYSSGRYDYGGDGRYEYSDRYSSSSSSGGSSSRQDYRRDYRSRSNGSFHHHYPSADDRTGSDYRDRRPAPGRPRYRSTLVNHHVGPGTPAFYFITKAYDNRDLKTARNYGVWTIFKTEITNVNHATECGDAYLIFQLPKENRYFGYARVTKQIMDIDYKKGVKWYDTQEKKSRNFPIEFHAVSESHHAPVTFRDTAHLYDIDGTPINSVKNGRQIPNDAGKYICDLLRQRSGDYTPHESDPRSLSTRPAHGDPDRYSRSQQHYNHDHAPTVDYRHPPPPPPQLQSSTSQSHPSYRERDRYSPPLPASASHYAQDPHHYQQSHYSSSHHPDYRHKHEYSQSHSQYSDTAADYHHHHPDQPLQYDYQAPPPSSSSYAHHPHHPAAYDHHPHHSQHHQHYPHTHAEYYDQSYPQSESTPRDSRYGDHGYASTDGGHPSASTRPSHHHQQQEQQRQWDQAAHGSGGAPYPSGDSATPAAALSHHQHQHYEQSRYPPPSPSSQERTGYPPASSENDSGYPLQHPPPPPPPSSSYPGYDHLYSGYDEYDRSTQAAPQRPPQSSTGYHHDRDQRYGGYEQDKHADASWHSSPSASYHPHPHQRPSEGSHTSGDIAAAASPPVREGYREKRYSSEMESSTSDRRDDSRGGAEAEGYDGDVVQRESKRSRR